MLWLIGGIVMAAVITVMFLRGRPSASVNPVPATPRLFAPVLQSGTVFHAPTIIANGLLLPPVIASTAAFYAPTVVPGATLAPPRIASAVEFFDPSVNLNLAAPLVTNAAQFFGSTLVKGAAGQTLVAPLITSAVTFYAPQLNLNIAAPRVGLGPTFFPIGIFAGTVPGTLSTPVVTLTSTAGEAPAVDITMGADIFAGYYLRIQRSADGVKNTSDGSYKTPTLNITHLVSPSEVAALAITNADLAPDGYSDPTGSWYQQYRWEREDGAISAWSNEISDTVTVSTAKWNTATGVNKSMHVNVDSAGFQAWSNKNNGAVAGVRATVEMYNDKAHAELTINDLCDSGGRINFGVTNGTLNLQTNVSIQGLGSYPGTSIQIAYNSTGATIGRNAGSQSVQLPAVPAAGDIISLDINRLTNTVVYKYYRLATGTTTTLATIVLTTSIPANWYLFSAYNKGLSPTNRDDGTTNFGASTFTVTPLPGHSFYA